MLLLEKLTRYTSTHRIASHILFWLCMYFLMVSRYDFDEKNIWTARTMITCSFTLSFSIIFAYFFCYYIVPKLIAGKHYSFVILQFLVGSYLISVFSRIMVVHVLEPIVRTPPFDQESILEILIDIPKLFMGYFLHAFSNAAIFVFCKLIKDQYRVQKRSLVLEKEKAETELNALKGQLNPHFLFNTLNNIYSLSLINSPVTSQSIARLSEILDHLLYRCNNLHVPVSQEIALLNNYIALEKLRYDERLKVSFKHNIDRDGEIAPLILISLVENAFKHGAGEDAGAPVINANLKLANNRFQFVLNNSYHANNHKEGNGKIGLSNIRKQLDLLYPGKYELNTFHKKDIFTASLEINLDPA